MKCCYIVRNVDEDCEYAYAVVARSRSEAKKIGMSLLECDYIEVRAKKNKDIDVSHLLTGEIDDYQWALSKGLYAWIEDKCPRCEVEANRVRFDTGFFCEHCEDDFYKHK